VVFFVEFTRKDFYIQIKKKKTMEFSEKNLDILDEILEIEKLSFPKKYGEERKV